MERGRRSNRKRYATNNPKRVRALHQIVECGENVSVDFQLRETVEDFFAIEDLTG
jgi:hypothetical protein